MEEHIMINEVVADMETTLRRFMGNKSLWERFVRKFPGDAAYGELVKAVQGQDVEEVICQAHTLKGTSANLGFDVLSAAASRMVEHGRKGKPECFAQDLAVITAEYDRVLQAIENLE